jgi:hypothetical protein
MMRGLRRSQQVTNSFWWAWMKNDYLAGRMWIAICLMALFLFATTSVEVLAGNNAADSRVSIAHVGNLPAIIPSAHVSTDAGRRVSVLHYTIRNSSEETYRKFQVVVYIEDANGQVKGGEVWVEHTSIVGGESQDFGMPLGHYLEAEDHVVVALKGIAGPSGAWDSPAVLRHSELVAGRAVASPAPDVGECNGNFCTTWVQAAREVCQNGVRQFSCGQMKCTVSFQCN